MENVVIFYDHLEYFTAIGYNLWPFWHVWTKKNLATLLCSKLNLGNNILYLSKFLNKWNSLDFK
jgi:hypothetical protein